MAWYYTFEAKEIQTFILKSDKLRDMVGGSELVNRFCGEFLEKTLVDVGVADVGKAIIAGAAGWARIRFEDEVAAKEFYAVWPLLASRFAPGLKVIQALVKEDGTLYEAMEQGFSILRGERNRIMAEMPEICPLVERCPRTGTAAVTLQKEPNEPTLVPVARETLRKRSVAKDSALPRKISSEFYNSDWPLELDEIVSEDSAYVAVVHADGNDLGATIMKITDHLKALPEKAEDIYRALSFAIEKITVDAVKAACEATIFPCYREQVVKNPQAKIPARLIVLGGDDLTLILRADLAVAFTRVFLAQFEKGSVQILKETLGKFGISGLPEALTACAGISFVKKAYPFASAYHMAETLCDHTKRMAKEDRNSRAGHQYVPSSLTFHRITTSMAEGFGEVKEKELTGKGGTPVKLWMGPYAVGDHGGGLPPLTALDQLCKALVALPTGSIHSLIETLFSNPADATKDYARILQIAPNKAGTALDQSLRTLTRVTGHPLWNDIGHSPLFDAHLLREMAKGGFDDKHQG